MVTSQFTNWQTDKTLLRIITVEKGKGHQTHVGNIIFYDESSQSILFYDLDQKKNYNLSMSEIEDIHPFQKPAKKEEKPSVRLQVKYDPKEKAINIIKELSMEELQALLPLLQLIAKRT
ncbi:hypothetical protein BHU72_09795 [Desulfuribacillus stibiiarsenatis]|uniref:Uncharacterized protein n=1 Tax=Desulfuribacillus stibiiarsenatis TaxID=1390249 RepID=A0A1E5L3I0_9FIRM|nr:hypothetical protein [Desulfuribacillus stibiiarsenatis]OEH84489.1 hypothetical protein BHU72_09795 [Desulfuribacillus stibiiarsenatis]